MIFKKNLLKYSSKEEYVLDKGHVDKGIGWFDQISGKSLTCATQQAFVLQMT